MPCMFVAHLSGTSPSTLSAAVALSYYCGHRLQLLLMIGPKLSFVAVVSVN